MSKALRILAVALMLAVAFCSLALAEEKQPIMLEGAMDVETQTLIAALENAEELNIGGYKYVRGTIDGYPVVVCKTQVGMVNSATTTTLGIVTFAPLCVINQGTAGGHDEALHRGDIVIGTKTVNINAFKSDWCAAGAGMHPEAWQWMSTEIDVDKQNDFSFEEVTELPGDEKLSALALSAAPSYTKGNVVEGVIGSGDVWNKELDRIALIRAAFNTSCEEMETFAAAQVCAQMNVPFLGIRILSNNEIHEESFEPQTGVDCQEYVLNVLRAIIAAQ